MISSRIIKIIFKKYHLGNDNELLDELKGIRWPNGEDFKGAIHGLLRVQYTYGLQIEELPKGKDIHQGKNMT